MNQLIRARFDFAHQSGALVLTQNILHTILDQGISFQIRFIKVTGKKPKSQLKERSMFNPFLPPDPELTVTNFDHHNVVLNKYSIARDHILITTSRFESQFSSLQPKDFDAALLMQYELNEEGLLFFYNCGSNSGASVLHKHIQMLRCKDVGIPIDSLVKPTGGIFMLPEYPFVHGCVALMEKETGDSMAQKLAELIEFTFKLVGADSSKAHPPVDIELEPNGFVSYNLLFTNRWMMLVPRSSETVDGIGVNSVGFAGMLLAKSQSEFEYLQAKGPLSVLKSLSFPKSQL
jgi:sulfate adenylyltransferase (ADP) / ATP adenylyltransferase